MSCFPLCCWHWLLTLSLALYHWNAIPNASPCFLLWRNNPAHKVMVTHASSICFCWRLALCSLLLHSLGTNSWEIGLLKIDGNQRLFRLQYVPYHANCLAKISGRNINKPAGGVNLSSWRVLILCLFIEPNCMYVESFQFQWPIRICPSKFSIGFDGPKSMRLIWMRMYEPRINRREGLAFEGEGGIYIENRAFLNQIIDRQTKHSMQINPTLPEPVID